MSSPSIFYLPTKNAQSADKAIVDLQAAQGVQSAAITSLKASLGSPSSDDLPDQIVKRDASGNFKAGTITATLDGSATTCQLIPELTGDVTSVDNQIIIQTLAGKTAAAVASAVDAVQSHDTTLAQLDSTLQTVQATQLRHDSLLVSLEMIQASQDTALVQHDDALQTVQTTQTQHTGRLSALETTQASHDTALSQHDTALQAVQAEIASATAASVSDALVKRDAAGNFAANMVTATLNGTASTCEQIPSLSGDVTSTANVITVQRVGNKTKEQIANAVDAVEAAASHSGSNTLVKRDANGDTQIGTALCERYETLGSTLTIGSLAHVTSAAIASSDNITGISIGAGSTAKTITIGAPGDTVTVPGTLTTVGTSNLDVSNSTITVNVGGAAGSGGSCGVDIEEGGAITGYFRVSGDRTRVQMKAPLVPEIELDQSLLKTSSPQFSSVKATFNGNLNGTATTCAQIPALSGDVTTSDNAVTVQSVGGASKEQIATAVTSLANISARMNTAETTLSQATSSDVPNTLVKRDAQGNVALNRLTVNGNLQFQPYHMVIDSEAHTLSKDEPGTTFSFSVIHSAATLTLPNHYEIQGREYRFLMRGNHGLKIRDANNAAIYTLGDGIHTEYVLPTFGLVLLQAGEIGWFINIDMMRLVGDLSMPNFPAGNVTVESVGGKSKGQIATAVNTASLALVDGGNSFGRDIALGSNDSGALNFRTSGQTTMQLNASTLAFPSDGIGRTLSTAGKGMSIGQSGDDIGSSTAMIMNREFLSGLRVTTSNINMCELGLNQGRVRWENRPGQLNNNTNAEEVHVGTSVGTTFYSGGHATGVKYGHFSLPGVMQRKKISLLDYSPNTISHGNSNFYGFGNDTNTLVYQVPSGAAHKFYVDQEHVATIDADGIWGKHMTDSGLFLMGHPFTGYACFYRVVRYGAKVTLEIGATSMGPAGIAESSVAFDPSVLLPAWSRPPGPVHAPCIVKIAGVYHSAFLIIAETGAVSVQLIGTSFSTDFNQSWERSTATWLV